MYKLIRPEICIPVHGEPVHIHEQARLARANGIKKTVEVENGSVVLIDRKNPKIINFVENGYLAVDGDYLLPDSSPIFKMRRKIRDSGIVVASIIVNGAAKLVTKPLIVMPGLLDPKEDEEFLDFIKQEVIKALAKQKKQSKGRLLIDQIQEFTRLTIKRILKHEVNKSPIIIVNIAEVDQEL